MNFQNQRGLTQFIDIRHDESAIKRATQKAQTCHTSTKVASQVDTGHV